MKKLVALGVCTPSEFARSMKSVKGTKRRNLFWKSLGYPNLVRARAAAAEARRRRRLLGLAPNDHSLDDVLEYAAALLPPSGFEKTADK